MGESHGQPVEKKKRKPINPDVRDEQIPYKGSVYAWSEVRDKRTGEKSTKTRHNEPGKVTVWYRKRTDTWSYNPKNPHYMDTFTFYEVVTIDGKGTHPIGRITEHTTEERKISLFYRYFNPDHLGEFSFQATVRFNGYTPGAISKGRTSTKTPYVTIPAEIVQKYDIHVDDEIEISVKSNGHTVSDIYHVSRMNTNNKNRIKNDGTPATSSFIIPLNRFKRYAELSFPEDPVSKDPPEKRFQKLVTPVYKSVFADLERGHTNLTVPWIYLGKKYDELPEKERKISLPCVLFIAPGDPVEVSVTPYHPDQVPELLRDIHYGPVGRFDFAEESLYQIQLEREASD